MVILIEDGHHADSELLDFLDHLVDWSHDLPIFVADAAIGGRHGEALGAITIRVAPETDPSAVVAASRRGDEPWFCFEQPDRDRAAVAALGAAAVIEHSGPERFRQTARRWRALSSHAAPGKLRRAWARVIAPPCACATATTCARTCSSASAW